MAELLILTFDNQATADQARLTLQQVAGQGVVVLPDLETAGAQVAQQRAESTTGLRRWALLPWRASARVLGGALTVVTWTSLVLGAVTGGLAGRLLGRDEQEELRQQVAEAVQPGKTPVILLTQSQLSADLIADIIQSSQQVYRTRVSADAAARIRSAFGSG